MDFLINLIPFEVAILIMFCVIKHDSPGIVDMEVYIVACVVPKYNFSRNVCVVKVVSC